MTKLLTAFAVLAALAASAPAQKMGGACMMTELQKLCGSPGQPGFQACAQQKSGEAMAACQGGGAAPAGEAGEKAAPKGKNPCADDMKKYCPGMWPGTPEFHKCMEAHKGDVTPECAAYGKKMAGKHGGKYSEADKACVDDAKKVCPGLTGADGGKFMGCMTSHYDELSPLCQKQFKGAKGTKGGKDGDANAVDCMAEMKKVCPEADPGTPEMMKCMIEHKDELPAQCRKGKKGKK